MNSTTSLAIALGVCASLVLPACGGGAPESGATATSVKLQGAGASFPADYTASLYVDTEQTARTGYLVEFGESRQMFEDPSHRHTKQYMRGEFS